MNLDNCAMSISLEASSSSPSNDSEAVTAKSPESNVKFKILKSKSSDSSSLGNFEVKCPVKKNVLNN